jgi:hypothetical protein
MYSSEDDDGSRRASPAHHLLSLIAEPMAGTGALLLNLETRRAC